MSKPTKRPLCACGRPADVHDDTTPGALCARCWLKQKGAKA